MAHSACVACSQHHDFDLPPQLLSAIREQRVVLFAGAGISTERKILFPDSLYAVLAEELGDPETTISFPDLITRYCKRPNGRANFLRRIHERFAYIKSFPELYRIATAFHREISTLWQITDIVTTNWDDFFERECGAQPFVSPQDFVFWNIPGRRVLKIHGSIANLGSIVATREEYSQCQDRLRGDAIGGSLRHMLATHTFLFVGYSLHDEDFLSILRTLTSDMKGLRPHAYMVTLDRSALGRVENLDMTSIVTDAVHFVRVLKKHLVKNGQLLSDERIESLIPILFDLNERHDELVARCPPTRSPEVVHCASFQDGMTHAIERILELAPTGYYSWPERVEAAAAGYASIRREKLQGGCFHDVAYVDGYVAGLKLLLASDTERAKMARYYVFGSVKRLTSLSAYRREARKADHLHTAAYRQAEMLVAKNLKGGQDVVPHHTPYL